MSAYMDGSGYADSDDEIPDLESDEEEDDEDSDEEDDEEESESEEEEEEAPLTPESLKQQGNVHYKARDFAKAITVYGAAIDLATSISCPDASIYLNRASAYMMKLMYTEAVADCDAALAIDSDSAKALFRKGKCLLSLGKPQEAVAAFTFGLVKEPGNAAAKADRTTAEQCIGRITLAKQCLGRKQYVQVCKQIQELEKHFSGGVEIAMMKVEALCCVGRHQESYAITTNLMRSHPNREGLLFWRAKCLYYMDQVAPAIKHLQEAMRNDPDNSWYRTEIKKWRTMEAQKEAGNDAFKKGNFQEAIAKWTECLSIDPDHRSYNAKLHLNRGTANAKLRKHQEAIDDCGKAIELDGTYIKAYNKRAESLRVLGEKEGLQQALRDLEKAMELDSEEKTREYKQKMRECQAELKRAGREDFYKILGAPKDATLEEIKKIYKKAALKWHPDRWASKTEQEKTAANETFQKINRAFEVLSDPVKRRRYDAGVEDSDLDDEHGGGGGRGHHGGMSPEMMNMFMRQHMGGGGFSF